MPPCERTGTELAPTATQKTATVTATNHARRRTVVAAITSHPFDDLGTEHFAPGTAPSTLHPAPHRAPGTKHPAPIYFEPPAPRPRGAVPHWPTPPPAPSFAPACSVASQYQSACCKPC